MKNICTFIYSKDSIIQKDSIAHKDLIIYLCKKKNNNTFDFLNTADQLWLNKRIICMTHQPIYEFKAIKYSESSERQADRSCE